MRNCVTSCLTIIFVSSNRDIDQKTHTQTQNEQDHRKVNISLDKHTNCADSTLPKDSFA